MKIRGVVVGLVLVAVIAVLCWSRIHRQPSARIRVERDITAVTGVAKGTTTNAHYDSQYEHANYFPQAATEPVKPVSQKQ